MIETSVQCETVHQNIIRKIHIDTVAIMKYVCVALVCLSVVGGLINCSPVDLFPERVLTKLPEQGKSVAIVNKLAKSIMEMFPDTNERQALEALEGIDGLEEHLESVERSKNLQDSVKDTPSTSTDDVASKVPEVVDLTKEIKNEELPEVPAIADDLTKEIKSLELPADGTDTKVVNRRRRTVAVTGPFEEEPVHSSQIIKRNTDFIIGYLKNPVSAVKSPGDVASKLPIIGDLTKGIKNEEPVILEPTSEGTDSTGTDVVSRKRRSDVVPGTRKLNDVPYVEARYEVENSVPEPQSARSSRSGHFVKGNGDFMVSEPDALGSNRPVIIYINKLARLHLENIDSDDSD